MSGERCRFRVLLNTAPSVDSNRARRQCFRGLENFGQGLFGWLSNRLGTSALILYQFYIRLALLGMSWPYLLLAGIPAIREGFMVRRIERTNVDHVSPVIHHDSI